MQLFANGAVARRHTRFIERDLPRVITTAVGRLTDMRQSQDAQIRAINAITAQHRINLQQELRRCAGVETTDQLTISSASELIDSLKSTTNGSAGRR